ncbi:MAG: two-component system response regulator [Elusimicrobia bacterium CG_4_9_14_3_um_filter_62_55]|nr:MAG: two-component system response regulator [Elusimicrobia bacterium CG22_combo_CG10-13_8_21_14_all_63_91]PJA16356.1 MAG: two-component system response regulator [Elusimicrobia bacterium CG_4_10_14_0_2_um_filter_63_34]PJB26893.1 MAG: two-component system response regulator [Elusimicrobia bacterium CG_4_9_14_3_um_filter_62_55]
MIRKKILLADDEDDFRELMTLYLMRVDRYELFEARDGGEALEKAIAESPDLILLDLMMPVLDGFQVASELTARLGVSAPKILIVTGRNLVEEDAAILLSGAIGIMRKPVKMEQLLKNVERALAGDPLDADWSAIQ